MKTLNDLVISEDALSDLKERTDLETSIIDYVIKRNKNCDKDELKTEVSKFIDNICTKH